MSVFDIAQNGLIRRFREGIEAAMGMPSNGDRVDRLLDLRDGVHDEFSQLKGQGKGAHAAATAVMVAGGFIFAIGMALGGHIAIPAVFAIVLAGGGTAIGGMAYRGAWEERRERAGSDEDVLVQKINHEVQGIIAGHPQETMQSPRFRKDLSEGFNACGAIELLYESQGERLAKAAAPAVRR